MTDYKGFLQAKIMLAKKEGFALNSGNVHKLLKPHQRDIVLWSLLGGCRAVFASFGLGKTIMQLETLRQVSIKYNANVLIVCPLGVKHEFFRDGKKLGIDRIKYITNTNQIEEGQRFYITNYERIRKGDINPDCFKGVTFDEASILRSLDTDTTDMILKNFKTIPYRFVHTATPSPNRFLELLNYAEFLGIADRGQLLTRFFQRDSTTAGNLTLYPRREKEFWFWMSSWSVFLTKPSDLGYDNTGYDLPPLKIHRHLVSFERNQKVDKKTLQTSFVADSSKSLVDAAKEKRDSIPFRVGQMLEIINDIYYFENKNISNEANKRAISTVQQNSVRKEQRSDKSQEIGTLSSKQGQDRQGETERVYGRISNDLQKETTNPRTKGQKECQKETSICLRPDSQTDDKREGKNLQSEEPREKDGFTLEEYARNDLRGLQYNIGDARGKLRDLQNRETQQESKETLCRPLPQNGADKGDTLPFLQLWIRKLQGQYRELIQSNRIPEQLIIWCHRNDEQKFIEKVLSESDIPVASISGSESIERKEQLLIDWKDKKYTILLSKPEILGSGMNFQQACKAIFVGIDYRFNDFIQAVHRIYRFMQMKEVEVHIIYTDAEDEILKTLEEKWNNHLKLQNEMTDIIQNFGLNSDLFATELKREMFTGRKEMAGDGWKAVNNDCVDEWTTLEDNSIDLIVSSIPFGNHYEYSENYNCFGHNETNEGFFSQMDYLVPHLYRTLKPGRIAAIHVKDRIRYSYMNGTGFTSIDPFSDDTTQCFRKHGFHLLSRITIDTDVVQENNQTYRLGWSEACKDMTKMGAGLPEYVLIFRKAPTDSSNAYADEPVQHSKEHYTRARWQLDAHAHWKSSSEKLISTEYLKRLDLSDVLKIWKEVEHNERYDFKKHVEICERLDEIKKLPSSFMAVPPQANSTEIWDDITRMKTLNSTQAKKNLTKHICPLQLDIIERLIERYSNEGDLVADPFGGIMSVTYQAVKMGRKGFATELNSEYWSDGVKHLRSIAIKSQALTLF